jgi:hypothetical protein
VRAQLGAEADHAPHVVVGQVAEHPAGQHQIGRDHPGVLVGQRRVRGHHLDPRQARGLGGFPGRGRVARIDFDQAGRHVVAAGVAGQDADHVAALARAQADRVQRTWRRRVQRHADLVLDRRQAAGERGAGLVVVVVPSVPVHLRHIAHATEVADDDVRTGRGPAEVQYGRNPAGQGHHRIIFCD